MFKFELGDKLKDKITGFIGVAVSRSEYINGCMRYELTPRVKKDGTLPDGYWMDEASLVLVQAKKVKVVKKKTGGPITAVSPTRSVR